MISHLFSLLNSTWRLAPQSGRKWRTQYSIQDQHLPLGRMECRISSTRRTRRAGGVLIPKEKDASDISQFRPICLLNVEGKTFFSVIAQRLSAYLEKNKYVDTYIQKAGIPGFSGCLEHTSMIWHQIQAAKKDKQDLHVTFLDLDLS